MWLSANPAPESRQGESLGSNLRMFAALGELAEGFVDEVVQAEGGRPDRGSVTCHVTFMLPLRLPESGPST